jgi:hypothetical protein
VALLMMHKYNVKVTGYAALMEGCLVLQPTLDLRWTGKTGSSYLCCTEVGMKVGDHKLKIYVRRLTM